MSGAAAVTATEARATPAAVHLASLAPAAWPSPSTAGRGRLAESYAVATTSLAAIRRALRAAWLAGDLSRDGYDRRSAALKRVGGRADPGRALNASQVGKLFRTAAGLEGEPSSCGPFRME